MSDQLSTNIRVYTRVLPRQRMTASTHQLYSLSRVRYMFIVYLVVCLSQHIN